MYYSFEYDYSYADTLSWGAEIRDILVPQRQKMNLVLVAFAVQFLIWLPLYIWLSRAEFSVIGTAAILFCGIIVVSNIYTVYIEPSLIRVFEGKTGQGDIDRFSGTADITDDGIKFVTRSNQTTYNWDAFHSVHDTEKNVIFIGDTLHAVIPAKCFSHFLEKDEFVRECKKRIPAYRSDGPEAFD